jgi:hypothetical protein
MSGVEAPLGRLERYLIRMPKREREERSLGIGDSVRLKTVDGKELVLTVQPALKDDAFFDESTSYITKEVFDRVNVGKRRKVKENVELLREITLGCDPEFFMVDIHNKHFLSAGSIFGGRRTKLGTDSGMVEIRPDPALHEDGVVENMAALIRIADRKITEANRTRDYYRRKQLGFIARSHLGIRCAGFHLHFGLHRRLKQPTPAVREFIRQVVQVMDYYVTLPSIIPEGVEECGRRSGPGRYGIPGDFKLENGITLEYRVPGGHHMRSPELARGLIGTGALVIEDVLSRTKVITNGFRQLSKFSTYQQIREMYPRIPARKNVVEAVRSKDTRIAYKYIDRIAEDLANMLSFKTHEDSVAKFIEYIAGGNHNTSELMLDNWS